MKLKDGNPLVLFEKGQPKSEKYKNGNLTDALVEVH